MVLQRDSTVSYAMEAQRTEPSRTKEQARWNHKTEVHQDHRYEQMTSPQLLWSRYCDHLRNETQRLQRDEFCFTAGFRLYVALRRIRVGRIG